MSNAPLPPPAPPHSCPDWLVVRRLLFAERQLRGLISDASGEVDESALGSALQALDMLQNVKRRVAGPRPP